MRFVHFFSFCRLRRRHTECRWVPKLGIDIFVLLRHVSCTYGAFTNFALQKINVRILGFY